MFEQYQKTFIPIQSVILLTCILLVTFTELPFLGGVFFFFVMETGAFIGAAWAARLRRKLHSERDRLPTLLKD